MNKRIRKTNILNFFLHFIKNSRERLFYDHAWCFCEEDYWELTHSIIMKSKDESVWSQLAFHWKGLVGTVCRYQLLSLWFNSILLFSILIDYTYMLLKRKENFPCNLVSPKSILPKKYYELQREACNLHWDPWNIRCNPTGQIHCF